MTRKRKTSCASAYDEGSCSHNTNSQMLSWPGRAIISTPPFEHWRKPSEEVICNFQHTLHSTLNQLATLRRQKRRCLLATQRQTRVPVNINRAQIEVLIRHLQAKANRISRKLKLHVIRSQPTTIGDAQVPLAREPPSYLRDLMNSENLKSSHFQQHIREYNGVFCFTSLGGKVHKTLNRGDAPYIYYIGGHIFHRIGSLLPPEGNAPLFAQLYMVDTATEVDHSMNSFTTDVNSNPLRPQIIKDLKDMFDEHNALTRVFRVARDRVNLGDVQSVKIKLMARRTADGREYDLPTVDEQAGLIVDEMGEDTFQPDIVVQYLTNSLERVNYTHSSLMALQYPILFPYGEDGWHENIPLRNSNTRKHLSQCDFYAYRIQTRLQNVSHILLCGKLFQQYVVNAYALVEAERLDWIRDNQWKLRKHYYHGLVDAMNRGDADLEHNGKRIILAASHTGSPRCKFENFQDAMAICRSIGFPDLFITFTCNAYWPEIQYMIELVNQSRQRDPNRVDVIARVFKLKLNQLMFEVKKKNIFGKCIGYVHAIEFQKRGLPHAHILVFLSVEDKIHSTSQIDAVISAEIPDSIIDPQCYAAVTNYMFHGPCGALGPSAPCTVKKNAPSIFQSNLTLRHPLTRMGFQGTNDQTMADAFQRMGFN